MRDRYIDSWPIDERAALAPEGWPGWPNGKRFAFVLTHDVEHVKGRDRCLALAALEEQLGFRSSFNFPPERYDVPSTLRNELVARGHEVGVHGLNHDGKLFVSRSVFQKRSQRINHYLASWGVVGFRAPAMHHNLDWIHDLNIEYDTSTFDTDPFEPQPDGMGTIFPFWLEGGGGRKGYVELPYTLPQDFTVMILMAHEGLEIWKRKLDWIARNGGMALLNTHPDYMCFEDPPAFEEYPVRFYEDFLRYVGTKYGEEHWSALPRDVAKYCAKINPEGVRQGRPRRVCMLAYTFYESDNRVMRYAEALAKRGDKVDVIALRSKESPKEEMIQGVRIFRIQERVIDEKSKMSYLVRLLRFLTKSSVFLWRRQSRNPYHLVHVHNVPDFLVFSAWRQKLAGAKIILDIHDIVPEFYADKFVADTDSSVFRVLRFVEKLSAGFADHVIVSNHLWEQKLVSRTVPAKKCSTFLNYPDAAIFQQREIGAHHQQNGKFVLSYPGTLAWHQGLDIAIRAVGLLKDRIPGLEFQIFGGGHQEQELRDLVRDLGLADFVKFKGGMPIREISSALAETDIGIVPKRKDSFGNEAFSTKIFEFMHLGVPVIAADTKIDTYYFNNSIVKFFESGNEQDLAEAIYSLWKNDTKRRELVENASVFIQDYMWDRRKQDYFTLVDSLITR